MFKFYCLLHCLTIKLLIRDIHLQDQLLNKLAEAQQLINNKEYFNAKLALDNLRHIYNINKITDIVLVKQLDALENTVKGHK